MSLSAQLNADMKEAMKTRNKFRLSVIRMLLAAIKNAEIDRQQALTDEQVEELLGRELKQRKDSLQEFEKAGRQDLATEVQAEIEIIAQYLPEPLSEAELTEIVQQTIRETGAASKADMGKVMAALMPKVKGRADGKQVNQLVQQHLS